MSSKDKQLNSRILCQGKYSSKNSGVSKFAMQVNNLKRYVTFRNDQAIMHIVITPCKSFLIFIFRYFRQQHLFSCKELRVSQDVYHMNCLELERTFYAYGWDQYFDKGPLHQQTKGTPQPHSAARKSKDNVDHEPPSERHSNPRRMCNKRNSF